MTPGVSKQGKCHGLRLGLMMKAGTRRRSRLTAGAIKPQSHGVRWTRMRMVRSRKGPHINKIKDLH
jgi:hypothetical protein